MIVGMGMTLTATTVHPMYMLRFNLTPSAPRGLYLLARESKIERGSEVFVELPFGIASFAAERDYLARGLPILKQIVAVGGQSVCQRNAVIFIDRTPIASLKSIDGDGRPLPAWEGCRKLRPDELFLMSTYNPASFDSRYFGTIERRQVIGRAIELWTW